MKKRQLSAVLTLLALTPLLFAACANAPAKSDETLPQHGLSMILAMDELAGSEAYRSAMSASGDLSDAMARMGQSDYDTPLAVYEILMPNGAALTDIDVSGLSRPLQGWLAGRAYASIPNQITACSGPMALAASASVGYGEAFVSPGITEPRLYLYQYGGDYSAMACFVPGKGDAVTGSVSFIPNDTGLGAVADAPALSAWLKELLYLGVDASLVSLD